MNNKEETPKKIEVENMNNKDFYFTIQSSRRSNRVKENIQKFIDFEIFWYVPENEISDYISEGAKNVIGVEGVPPMKSRQLNSALLDGYKLGFKNVITCDDDLLKVIECRINDEGKIRSKKIEFSQIKNIVKKISILMDENNLFLGGFAPTTNVFFTHQQEYKLYGSVWGAFLIHRFPEKKENILFFNEELRILEDVDVMIKHHLKNRGVLRYQKNLVDFSLIGKNKVVGGYEGFRKYSDYELFNEYIKKTYSEILENIKFEVSSEDTDKDCLIKKLVINYRKLIK